MVTNPSDGDDTTGIRAYFLALQEQLSASLGFTSVIPHPVGTGDEAEGNWTQMLAGHLPWRYQVVDKCFVVDHRGEVSDEIDLLLCDRQYTTLVFRAGARLFVPAEAVYAVFEVKPRINLAHVDYAAEKVASVRRLSRTSAPVVHAGGRHDEPKEPAHIIGGLLTTGSDWNPPLGSSFESALETHAGDHRLDIGCVVHAGGWQTEVESQSVRVEASQPEEALVYFYLRLLAMLQQVGTVPAMDFELWSSFLRSSSD